MWERVFVYIIIRLYIIVKVIKVGLFLFIMMCIKFKDKYFYKGRRYSLSRKFCKIKV